MQAPGSTIITCVRCFFAFKSGLGNYVHVCPSCGTVMRLKDDSEQFASKYSYEVCERSGSSEKKSYNRGL
jgi:predicted RNA-binding Zn-ribbon protein involved in translation (DUF1610 family)